MVFNNEKIEPGHRSAIAYVNNGTFDYIRADSVQDNSRNSSFVVDTTFLNKRKEFNTYLLAGNYETNHGLKNNAAAFTALDKFGDIYTWGEKNNGASSAINGSNSSNIVQIYSAYYAFAALNKDGKVHVWGPSWAGGNLNGSIHKGIGGSTSFNDLSNIVQIYSTDKAFAALDNSGDIYCWGDSGYGGGSDIYASNPSNIVQIYSTDRAFTALNKDGEVHVWGKFVWDNIVDHVYKGNGDDMSFNDLSNIVQIYSTSAAFAALDNVGDIYCWGKSGYGGSADISASNPSNIVQIYSTGSAFSALDTFGKVHVWGSSSGGNDNNVHKGNGDDMSLNQLSNIVQIYSTDKAFAALDNSGDIYCWGDSQYGGGPDIYASNPSNIVQIYSTDRAFTALNKDGEVHVWGTVDANGTKIVDHVYKGNGDDMSFNDLSNIVQIYSTDSAFAALDSSGDIYCWGNTANGGGDNIASTDQSNIVQIYSTDQAFAALDNVGKLHVWGANGGGGNPNGTAFKGNGQTTTTPSALTDIVMINNNFIDYRLIPSPPQFFTGSYIDNSGII